MQPFVTIHLSLNPSSEEMRKARELLAFFGSKVEVEEPAEQPRAAPPPPNAESAFQQVVPPPANTLAPSVDSKGLPWDERIHSGNKTQNQDGSWKKRKGVDEATVAQVEAQLRHGQPAIAAPPPPATVTPPPATVAPPPPQGTPAVALPAGATFVSMVAQKFADGVRAKSFPPTTAVDTAKAVGLATFVEVAHHPETWAKAGAYLDARATGVDHDTAVAML